MHHAMKNPPIGGDNEGRLMPIDNRCPPLSEDDPYFVPEERLSELLHAGIKSSMANRVVHGYDPMSCVSMKHFDWKKI